MTTHDFMMSFAADILKEMPENKKKVLSKALDRNEILTTTRTLGNGTITTYIQGWYLQFEGTRCGFSVWAGDGDDHFTFTRKPPEKKLRKLYDVIFFGQDCDVLLEGF